MSLLFVVFCVLVIDGANHVRVARSPQLLRGLFGGPGFGGPGFGGPRFGGPGPGYNDGSQRAAAPPGATSAAHADSNSRFFSIRG